MRHSAAVFVGVFFLSVATLAQNHIPVPHTTPHGTSRICWGYATGRAAGKFEGDANCDPATLIPDQDAINLTYFSQYNWSEIDSRPLESGDILYWPGTHAGYVTSVPHDQQGYVIVNSIGVAHMSASQWTGVIYETLSAAKSRVGVGNPSYFCRRKLISITVSNSFGGGDVKVSGSTVGSGSSVPANWWSTVSLEALNQNYLNVWRQWSNWQKNGGTPATQNPWAIAAGSGELFMANFTNWSDITFSNSLPGASGGTISVWDTVRNAPGTVRMPLNSSFNLVAINQTINLIGYTFSQWNDGNTSYSRTLTATQHASYTASFTPKPLPPDNISVGGQVGNPVQISWTMHPSTYVTEYQIWRKIKPKYGPDGNPVLLTTVGRTTTSYTDWDYYVTSGYTDDLVYYDVRSHFVCSPWNVYSDVNWSGGIFGTDYGKHPDGGDLSISGNRLPSEFSIGSYPNPFNPSTRISYQLVEDSDVTLEVFDVMGRKVASVVDGKKSAGYHSVLWFAKDDAGVTLASGIYFYRFIAKPLNGNQPIYRSDKLVLMK